MLNAVDAGSSNEEMSAAIDAACHVVVTNHPKEFHYEEAESEDGGATGKLLQTMAERAKRDIA